MPSFVIAAPVIRSPQPVDSGKISCGIYYEALSTNSILNNFSLSIGYGLAENIDGELFIYERGLVFNLKPALRQIDPFVVSGILEAGVDFNFNFHWGLAIMLDLKLYEFLNIFIGTKGRYPANQYLDNTMRIENGFQFMPFIGFEILRKFKLSIIAESGFSLSWDNRLPSYFISFGLKYKI